MTEPGTEQRYARSPTHEALVRTLTFMGWACVAVITFALLAVAVLQFGEPARSWAVGALLLFVCVYLWNLGSVEREREPTSLADHYPFM